MKRTRVTIALVICLTVSVSAMLAINRIAKVKLHDKAIKEAGLEADIVKKCMNLTMLSSNWMLNSFLAGFTDLSMDSSADTMQVHVAISRDELDRTGKEGIFRRMNSFMNYNEFFYCLMFIVNPGVTAKSPDGYAALVYAGDHSSMNLLERFNIYGTKFYSTVRDAGHAISKESQISGKGVNIWTIGIPLYDENGEFIGECWAEVTSKNLSELLTMFNASKDQEVSIISDRMNILASSDTTKNGRHLPDVLREYDPDNYLEGWLENVQRLMIPGKDSIFRAQYSGNECYTYVKSLSETGFYMVILKSVQDVNRAVNAFSNQFLLTSVLTMILLCLAMLYVFNAFSKENESIKKMENELEVASRIQRSILPNNTETDSFDVYGFQRQAKSVGGDLYDYFVKNGKLHFCLGDVSGKGIPASLVMAELCSLYRYIAKRREDAEDIMKTLNTAVLEHSDDSMICTLFIGVLDLETGVMGYCNAGHTPPVIIRKNGDTEVMTIQANMPVYAFENYPYKSSTIQLGRGDKVFLYTDGVTEARNEGNGFFGAEAMLETIRSNSKKTIGGLTDALLNEISSFSGKTEQSDDITTMCIEYKG